MRLEQRALPAASDPSPIIHQAPIRPLANVRVGHADAVETKNFQDELIVRKLNNIFATLKKANRKRYSLFLASNLENIADI